jgi:hypothetical protein
MLMAPRRRWVATARPVIVWISLALNVTNCSAEASSLDAASTNASTASLTAR